MLETIEDTYVGQRRFLPGSCGPEGEAAQVFIESDLLGTSPDPTVLKLASAACESCPVRIDCASQQEKIARTLHASGIPRPVVAGEVMKADDMFRYMTEREKLALEPRHEFDISGPLPESPLTAATLLRQWAVVHGRLLAGKPSRASLAVSANILRTTEYQEVVAAGSLGQSKARAIVLALSKILIAHERQDGSMSTWGRRVPEDQLDMGLFQSLTPLYLADASTVKELGFTNLDVVFYHGADFWRRVLKAYELSKCITRTSVIFHSEHAQANPIPQIEKQVAKNDARRKGTYVNPYAIPIPERKRQIKLLEATLAKSHPHVTRAMLVDVFKTSTNVEVALEKVEALKQPQVAELIVEYAGTLTSEALQRCLVHSEDPKQAIEDYFDRVDSLTRRMLEAGGNIAPGYIEAIAINSGSKNMTGVEVIVAAESRGLRAVLRSVCRDNGIKLHAPAWAIGRIVSTSPREEWWEATANLNELMETGFLRSDLLSCALETEAADIEGYLQNAVGKRGQHVTFSFEALTKHTAESRAAIIKKAKLDVLVYGHRIPERSDATTSALPAWLKSRELDILAEIASKGDNARLILNGQRPIPYLILAHFGNSRDAISAIRQSAIRGDEARRLHTGATRRLQIRENLESV